MGNKWVLTLRRHLNSILLLKITMFILLLSLAPQPVFSQERGDHTFDSVPALPLKKNITKPDGEHYSARGLGGIGGIYFEKTAQPSTDIKVDELKFDYDSTLMDGKRFNLKINGSNITVPIFDWMLVPIANYINSGFNSCFTYFGNLKDKYAEKFIQDNEGHILNYHPAFFNTLLGLRLADMDLLLMYDFAAEVPQKNGIYILGNGEDPFYAIPYKMAYYKLLNNANEAMIETGKKYRSYLISDYGQDILFSLQNDTLTISGYPYYYCWQYAFDQKETNKEIIKNITIESINNEINNLMESNLLSERDAIIKLMLHAVIDYDKGFSFYEEGTTIVDLTKLPEEGNQRKELLELYTTDALKEALISLRVNMAYYEPIFLKELSNRISNPELFRKANPLVWRATTKTLRYSAFFRYLQKKYPMQWANFISEIENIKIEPRVTTPTVMYPSEKSHLRNYLKALKD